MKQTTRAASRLGFTLVEILVVITIIGLLVGLLVPAVMKAVNSAQEGAYKLEVDTLAEAVEKYRTKYGDYPPDGSSWQIMERHLRKAFPQIIQSELNLLDPTTTANLIYQGWDTSVALPPWSAKISTPVIAGVRNDFDQSIWTTSTPPYAAGDLKVMDPAEALVFFLGGFSSNPQRPFTGEGGPFVVTVGAAGAAPPATGLSGGQTLQYNVQRSNPLFEFKTNRLSLIQETIGGIAVNISSDEEEYLGSALARDLLPVYLSRAGLAESAPFVYFDSRTYVFEKGTNLYANFFQRTPTIGALAGNGVNFGAIRPLVSEIARTPVIPPASRSFLQWYKTNLFLEDKKFQVIGPGQDDIYGGLMAQEFASPPLPSAPTLADRLAAYWTFPSGVSYEPPGVPGARSVKFVTRLLLPANLKGTPEYTRSTGIADNSANCTEKTLITTLKLPGQ